jgi:RNA polymerase sigma-70 factor (ECF subfamily)
MELTNHDMRKLINESATGDAESCKKLYEHLVDRIFAYVRSRTNTHEQAVDITQDVFIDFFSTLSNFRYQSQAQFYSYVFVITRRKLAHQYADNERRGLKTTTEFNEDTTVVSTVDTPHEIRSDIEKALTTLDAETREIVVLHHWSRYTFGEIALLMNMTESGVRVRHHRALKGLGVLLGELTT